MHDRLHDVTDLICLQACLHAEAVRQVMTKNTSVDIIQVSSQMESNVIPLHPHENPNWPISFLSSSQGRSSAKTYFSLKSDDQWCIIKVDCHCGVYSPRCITSDGGHNFGGFKRTCCNRQVEQYCNAHESAAYACVVLFPPPQSTVPVVQRPTLDPPGDHLGWPYDPPLSVHEQEDWFN